MQYSFIRPRPKQLVSPEMKLVLTFFSMSLVMLVSTYLFLVLKQFAFSSEIENLKNEALTLQQEITQLESKIVFIDKQAAHAEQVFTTNTVLKESIKNLFDLVPERITLSQAQLDHDKLVLYGVTPNKDVYEFLLHAPLRSIFHRTYSSFYPIENGWYRFVSTNYLDREEVE